MKELHEDMVRAGDVISSPARYLRRRRLGGWIVGLASVLNVGCYTTAPLMSEPQPNQRVVLYLNDQGRTALSEQLGPGTLSLEGLVDSRDSASYLMRVGSVTHVSTGRATWTGERVRIPRNAVSTMEERELSKPRTFAVIAVAGVALGVFIATRSLLGFGDSNPEPVPPPQGSS